MELTVREQKTLLFIYKFKLNREYSPSLREIGNGLGSCHPPGKAASTSVVSYYIRKLQKIGLLNSKNFQSRTVYLTPAGKAFALSLVQPNRTRNSKTRPVYVFGRPEMASP